MNKRCSLCQAEFSCGSDIDGEGCWCASLPAVMPLTFERGCECPACLARTIGKRITSLIARTPVADMVQLAVPWRDGQLHEHIDYEIEDGKYVFSKWFHLKRGICCGNGCRNCPYDHVNVGRT